MRKAFQFKEEPVINSDMFENPAIENSGKVIKCKLCRGIFPLHHIILKRLLVKEK